MTKPRRLLHLLIVLCILAWIFVALMYGVLLINRFSPYEICYNTKGESMLPAIREGDVLVMGPTPFEELQVGDIIQFKEDKTHEARRGYHNGTDKPSGFENMTVPPHTDMENPPYDRDVGIEYTDVHIIHRIIEIREADENFDRALFTQGDNNPEREFRSVMESGYESKVIYIVPFGGRLLRSLYRDRMIYALVLAALILTNIMVILIVTQKSADKNKPE